MSLWTGGGTLTYVAQYNTGEEETTNFRQYLYVKCGRLPKSCWRNKMINDNATGSSVEQIRRHYFHISIQILSRMRYVCVGKRSDDLCICRVSMRLVSLPVHLDPVGDDVEGDQNTETSDIFRIQVR